MIDDVTPDRWHRATMRFFYATVAQLLVGWISSAIIQFA